MIKIKIDNEIETSMLFGSLDQNLKLIEEHCGVVIIQREGELLIESAKKSTERASADTKACESDKDLGLGEASNSENSEAIAGAVISELIKILEKGEELDKQKISYVISLAENGESYLATKMDKDILCFTHRGKPLRPKTLGQKDYANSIRNKEIVFGIGPAGTGKTYIAVAMAINAFKNKHVQKIILARPAVEAGERLGFLPGDLQEKVDPYLRPLYDALYDILGRDTALRLKEKELIEVVPLAYMRGRTLDNSFIILDEAQNTTKEQMKMFLTRMGFGSRMVITGDVTQIDLPRGKKSGLVEASHVLKNVKDIDFCYLRDVDVVRHELVKKIIKAYDSYYEQHPVDDDE